MAEKILLVGDIGGTNARFALAYEHTAGFHDEVSLLCAQYPNIEQAIRFYLDQIGVDNPAAICLAIAGPVIRQQAKLTNNDWFISVSALSQQFPSARVTLLNDFTAIAHSIPWIEADSRLSVGPELNDALNLSEYKTGVIGPGTGLGVAGLIKQANRILPLTSEAGHMGFAAETELQIQILQVLRRRWARVSIERMLSGQGLENIHWAIRQLNNHANKDISAAQIFNQAVHDNDSLAYQSVQVFFEVLGQVAGDIALAYGAENGIYIAGGMVKRYPDLLQQSQFRQCFEKKGRHSLLMQDIPTFLITHPQPGLLGCSVLLSSKIDLG